MLRFFLAICLLPTIFAAAADTAIVDYLQLLQRHSQTLGPLGDYTKGEIEIVTDLQKIIEIQQGHFNSLIKKGISKADAAEYSKVGIIAQDIYWMFIRDAVIFPSGAEGLYDRLVQRKALNGPPGMVVLPILSDGRIALVLHYRHATRSWEFELPRGFIDDNETPEEGARRELEEETGLKVVTVTKLGSVIPDSGMTSISIPVYCGIVSGMDRTNLDKSEAIAGTYVFTSQELQRGVMEGFLTIQRNQREERIPIRDGFLSFALLQALLRGLL